MKQIEMKQIEGLVTRAGIGIIVGFIVYSIINYFIGSFTFGVICGFAAWLHMAINVLPLNEK